MASDPRYTVPASRHDFEIAIFCALPREQTAVLLLLDEHWDGRGGSSNGHRYAPAPGDPHNYEHGNTYEHGRIGRFNVVVVLFDVGKVPAARAAAIVQSAYANISLALVVGVCAGVPSSSTKKKNESGREEIILGDVLISKALIHLDFGRQRSDGFERKREVEDVCGRPPLHVGAFLRSLEDDKRLVIEDQAAEFLRQLQARNDADARRKAGRYRYPGVDKDRLFADDYEHKGSPDVECDQLGCDDTKLVPRQRLTQHRAQGTSPDPQIHTGRIGSGDSVMRSAQHRNALAVEGIIGIEMEGAGVWDLFPCIVVKGVCDYADSHKNKSWQDYAAATAASVSKALLDQYEGTKRNPHSARERSTTPAPAPFLNGPFQPDDDFVEREEITNWLHSKLKDKGTRAALVGFGGVGKSRLAIRYARNIQRTSPQTFVLWVYAGTQGLFMSSFRNIAEELGLDGWDNSEADVLRLVLKWLRPGNRDWLMILDNADDIDVFDPKPDERNDLSTGAASPRAMEPLDFLHRCQNGNIVITSRSERVVKRLGVGVHYWRVDPMHKGQARDLLRHKLTTAEDKSGEEDLVDALDCIPLAITHAAAYINNFASTGRVSVRTYLEQFREGVNNQAVLLNRLPEDASSKPVFMTWIITYERIQQERPSASDLLSLLSFFYHRGIPEWVLESYYKNFETYHPDAKPPQDIVDPLAEDLAVLCSYSLVTAVPVVDHGESQQPSSRSFQMHSLVHSCTRHWVGTDSAGSVTYLHGQ
ncbi:hypothetical protein B0T20DRAFT_54283 [Sordaria brevicollis]|uniref:Uncharacterized protein n=1 Tax=Sordaria brevicollis TaxID=83679 RepID=A0AAE0P3K6_SORBR|nr:hypothetical protein B0T20DRAFT_54283 [Sordaria brevicollis]